MQMKIYRSHYLTCYIIFLSINAVPWMLSNTTNAGHKLKEVQIYTMILVGNNRATSESKQIGQPVLELIHHYMY